METIFPTATGYQGLFLVSHRKNLADDTQIERTGTVLVKRTYSITPSHSDPAAGQVTPTAALPIFLQDQPAALVTNGDFETAANGLPTGWQAEAGVTIAQTVDPSDGQNHVLRVTGVADGRVTQTFTFPVPVAGRRFGFSFKARADAATTVANAQLEAAGQSICAVTTGLTTDWATFSASATWPVAANTAQVQVVLRMATAANRTLFYDDVVVHSLFYEHDLAAFKPQGDVIVLGFTAGAQPATINVTNQTWFSRMVAAGDPDLFGWQLRDLAPRQGEGAFPPNDSDYPLSTPLPAGFNNLYFNGYQRAARAVATVPYLPAAAPVLITRNGTQYGFTLAGENLSAQLFFYTGVGPDEECHWRRRVVSMNLDTLVVEPALNRCYTLWRGVWDLDEPVADPGAYRRLVVTAQE